MFLSSLSERINKIVGCCYKFNITNPEGQKRRAARPIK
jgi:hypothetical protein